MARREKINGASELVAATWFACKCFGITAEKAGLSRPKIQRAKFNERVARDVEPKLLISLGQLLRSSASPVAFAQTASLCDAAASSCLGIYRRLIPLLKFSKKDKRELHWLLVEKVWIPTCVAVLAERRRLGYENEFSPTGFAYLAGPRSPFQTGVEYWQRFAGLITAHGVARSGKTKSQLAETDTANEEALRKRVERWRVDVLPKTLDQIFEDIDATKDRLNKFGKPEQMKGRILLGFALQRSLDALDTSFDLVDGEPASVHAKKLFLQLGESPFVCARHRMLGMAHLQFALRLIWDAWQQEGWKPQAIEVEQRQVEADQDAEQVRKAMERDHYRASPEGQFAKRLVQQASAAGTIQHPRDALGLEEYVIQAAAKELISILKKRLAAKRRQP